MFSRNHATFLVVDDVHFHIVPMKDLVTGFQGKYVYVFDLITQTPKKKKAFIDKKNAETYLVIHRGQKFPTDFSEQETSQVPPKKDYEEHIRCGIFFDDDYDYMQHLRDLNEVAVLEKAEKFVSQKPKDDVPPPLDLELQEKKIDYYAPDEEGFDPEVEAALEGKFDFDNPDNELEDDFILAANDGVLPSIACQKNSLLQHRSRAESPSDDDIKSDDSGDDVNSLEGEEPIEEAANNDKRDGIQQRMIDEQFEHLCNQYDDDFASEAEEEHELETLLDPNSSRIKELAEERKNKKVELVLHNDEVAKRFAMEEDDDGDKFEDVTLDCSGPKKAKWDCESILSTYSNIYNRPCLITETKAKRKLKNFVKKADVCYLLLYSFTDLVSGNSEDYQMEEVGSNVSSVSYMRPKGETPEERKLRKALVKERRRERIVEKKCNKLAFKEERLRRQAQQRSFNIKTTPIV
uniref:Protein LTV1 homolog n=1 Tax=Syphacia muris TaxID=451379 RepID=A0A0N5AKD5_9BILA